MTVLLFVKGKCKNKFLFIFLLDIYHSDAYIHHKARGTLETSSKNRVFPSTMSLGTAGRMQG